MLYWYCNQPFVSTSSGKGNVVVVVAAMSVVRKMCGLVGLFKDAVFLFTSARSVFGRVAVAVFTIAS